MDQDYSDSISEATQIARTALPIASRHKLPANPMNYAVLYEYASGRNTQLKKEADEAIARTHQLTQELVTTLYKHYFEPKNKDVLIKTQEDIKSILTTALDTLQATNENTNQYQQQLKEKSKVLENDFDINNLRTVIDEVISTTRDNIISNNRLQDQLVKSNEELKALRQEFERAQSEALIDPLTNVNNRRSFDKQIDTLYSYHKDKGELCLLMLDIDDFKKVNDTLGHVIGDQVIKYVATCINNCIRGKDFVARYGGEEFAILLANTPASGAMNVANNICRTINKKQLKLKSSGNNIGLISVSIGVTKLNNLEASTTSFIERADSALYQAKRQGKNQAFLI